MMPACSSHASEYEIIGSFPIGSNALHMFSFSDNGYSLHPTGKSALRRKATGKRTTSVTPTHEAPWPARITAWNSLRPLRGAENMLKNREGVGRV
jgi:hypothetical protein